VNTASSDHFAGIVQDLRSVNTASSDHNAGIVEDLHSVNTASGDQVAGIVEDLLSVPDVEFLRQIQNTTNTVPTASSIITLRIRAVTGTVN